MLHEFLTENQQELAKRCRGKVSKRQGAHQTPDDLEFGIPLFIRQLITTLRSEVQSHAADVVALPLPKNTGAGHHGKELLRLGFTVGQVVHVYGDLCQSITEMAIEKHANISVDEFRTFNRCLDSAIAEAVTEFDRVRDQIIFEQGTETMNERLGYLAHEMRNKLNAAMLAFGAIKDGSVALAGATGAVLERSLIGLCGLIDQSLADVRLTAGLTAARESMSVASLIEEIEIPIAMEAKAKGVVFSISIEADLVIDADQQMISAAVVNLLRNALKFTRANGRVALLASSAKDRVIIEVTDECGGLPSGNIEELFNPFEQRGADRSGVGLGLSISRRGVEANGGKLSVKNRPGDGCSFVIDLRRPGPVASVAL